MRIAVASAALACAVSVGVRAGVPDSGAAQAAATAARGETPSAQAARPATGESIYQSACITCHGPDGTGAPRSVIGFDAPVPDFADCQFATAEPDADWFAVVHEGGPIRGLDRHMPAFADALTADEISLALGHIRTFCAEPAWPRGEFNLPRAFFTEKAFPENEAVWETGVSTGSRGAVANTLVYERRFGARNQIEVKAPIDFQEGDDGTWHRGLGDLAVGFKRVLYADLGRGRIAAAGAEVVLPTGKESLGLGNGYTIFEPFAMWGQILPRDSFLQMHGGVEIPSDGERGSTEVFVRTAVGTSFAQDRGFGRVWSPQVEVLFGRAEGGSAEWDIVPQVQITLSKLQHVMVAAGVRVPVTQRGERKPQLLVYVLWDWFDGSPFDFWK